MGEEKPYRFVLLTSEKEDLVDRIIELDKEVRRLREENEKLREKLKLPLKIRREQEKKESRGCPKPPHQWGRKIGHPGATRTKPAQADREIRQTLPSCPDCAQALGLTYILPQASGFGSRGDREHTLSLFALTWSKNF